MFWIWRSKRFSLHMSTQHWIYLQISHFVLLEHDFVIFCHMNWRFSKLFGTFCLSHLTWPTTSKDPKVTSFGEQSVTQPQSSGSLSFVQELPYLSNVYTYRRTDRQTCYICIWLYIYMMYDIYIYVYNMIIIMIMCLYVCYIYSIGSIGHWAWKIKPTRMKCSKVRKLARNSHWTARCSFQAPMVSTCAWKDAMYNNVFLWKVLPDIFWFLLNFGAL